MKSRRIINILFLFLSISSFAKFNLELVDGYDKQRGLVDSLFFSQNHIDLYERDAKAVLNYYDEAIHNGIVLIDEDLKRISISYATLNDSPNAAKYLEKYIKKSHDFTIVKSKYFEKVAESKPFLVLVKKYKPRFNLWFMFNFYIGLIGIFIAVVLNLKRDSDKIANLLISLFILFTSLFIIHIWVFISNVQFNFPHSLYTTIAFNFLYGPLLYFYFKRTTKQHIFKLKDTLHLIPFVLTAIYFFRYYVLATTDKLHILLNRKETFDPVLIYVVIFKIISLIAYGLLIYMMYKKAKENSLPKNLVALKWQRNVVILNSFYVFSHIFYVLMITGVFPMDFLIHPQLISMSLIVLYVGYVAYVQPKIFSHKDIEGALFLKYKKSGLTEDFSNDLKEQLIRLLHEDKIYKMNDINLEILSQMIGTTRHNISQVINEHFDMNFFKLVNTFRIQEAEEIFKNDVNHNLNIIDVAYDVGFNNKVTFNKAFKEQTQRTPTQYLKNLRTLNQNLSNYNVNLR